MRETIYTDGNYLEKHPTWHEEDSNWKAAQIAKIIDRNGVDFSSYVDIGCGAGRIVHELSLKFPSAVFHGYDVSPKALELAGRFETDRIRMFHQDALWKGEHHYDVAAAIDVLEHVEDYMGFLRRMRRLADYFIFHIPLDITVTSVLRNSFIRTRDTVGHLHYFTLSSALAALQDTGYVVLDYFYTPVALDMVKNWEDRFLWLPRALLFNLVPDLGVRMLGGFPVLVLAKSAVS